MAEGVPTNNQRGQRSGPCRLWGGLDKARHIVPTALLVRVQWFRKGSYKAVEGPSTRPIVLSMITGSYCRRRRRLTIFEPDEMKFGVWKASKLYIFGKCLMKHAFRKRFGQNRLYTSYTWDGRLRQEEALWNEKAKGMLQTCVKVVSVHLPYFASVILKSSLQLMAKVWLLLPFKQIVTKAENSNLV